MIKFHTFIVLTCEEPKAKLLMMLNLTTIDHYVNDSDMVSITSIKARIRIVTQ